MKWFMLLIVLISAGCTNSRPSEGDIISLYKEYLEKDKSNDTMTYDFNMKKINGYKADELTYIAEVDNTFKIKLDPANMREELIKLGYNDFQVKAGMDGLRTKCSDIKKDSECRANVNVMFKKTDNGWKLMSVDERQ